MNTEPHSPAGEIAATSKLRFPKLARLATAGEFRRVKEKGRTWPGRFIVLGVLTEAADTPARIGLITSRRVGGAVTRNRVRRLLRESVRPTRPLLVANCWVVLIARHTAARATLAELSAEWTRLARRAAILRPEVKETGVRHRGHGEP